MAAAINMHFDWLRGEFRQQFLKIAQNILCDSLATCNLQKFVPMQFGHRRVEGKNIVFLFVARLLLHHPIGDHYIAECVPGAPGIVRAVIDRFVVDRVDHKIRAIAK